MLHKPHGRAARGSFWWVWRLPIALGAVTLFGLLAALLGTGAWRGAAWMALSAPVVAIAILLVQPPRR